MSFTTSIKWTDNNLRDFSVSWKTIPLNPLSDRFSVTDF